jgi:hypothetical protein
MCRHSDFLYQELVRVTAETPECTAALTKLITKIDLDVVENVEKRVTQWPSKPDKSGTFTPILTDWNKVYLAGQAANVFRLATFDLGSLKSLVPTPDDPRSEDGAGSPKAKPHERNHAPKGYMKDVVRSYLKAVLRGPLHGLREQALAIASEAPGYQAVGTLDYYRDRSVDSHAFHKDTAGTTLFVALHYLNSVELLGAEYVHDTKPTKTGQWGPIVSDEQREKTSQKRPDKAWPLSLEQAMNTARAKLPLEPSPKIRCKVIRPNGMLTFVDELVYHASPFAGKRPALDAEQKKPFKYEDYLSVSMSEQRFAIRDDVPIDKPSKAFPRTVSNKDLRTPAKDPNDKRRFARLWICIQPKNWTKLA